MYTQLSRICYNLNANRLLTLEKIFTTGNRKSHCNGFLWIQMVPTTDAIKLFKHVSAWIALYIALWTHYNYLLDYELCIKFHIAHCTYYDYLLRHELCSTLHTAFPCNYLLHDELCIARNQRHLCLLNDI